MHDPMVVAFEIRRPFPSRRAEKVRDGQKRWEVTIHRKHGRDHPGWNPRRWWRPGSWSPFVNAFGRRWYFPSMVTVWHVEPGGRDSGEVCKHYDRWQDDDGKWHTKFRRAWRWHLWHWRIQIPPLQHLRARLFDRCAECGRKGRPNHSHQWDGHRLGWWKFRSREDLYHRECSALGSYRNACNEHELIHRRSLAALALAWDVPLEDVPHRLFAGTDGYHWDAAAGKAVVGEFNLRYRLDKLIEKDAKVDA